MVLVSFLLFTKIFNPNQINVFKKQLKNNSNDRVEYGNGVLLNVLWFSLVLIFLMLNVIPGVLIAKECSKGSILHILLGVLFSDIYVFHYALRKFVYRDNYCKV